MRARLPALTFLLGLVLPMGVFAARSAGRAHETLTLTVGDSILPAYSVRTDSVLAVAGRAIVATKPGTSTAFLRFYAPSHGGRAGGMLAADTVDVVVVAKESPSTPIPATATDTIARANFEDGTFGPFGHSDANGGADVTIIADPTNSGHGKVVAMHYRRDSSEAPGQGVDRNRFFGVDYARGVHLGESVAFEGDLYMPTNSTFTNPGAGTGSLTAPEWWQRKLLYWQRDPAGDGPTGNGFFTAILTSFGPAMTTQAAYIPVAGEAVYTQQSGVASFRLDHWQHIKLEVRLNSTLAARDGLYRLTVDGVVKYENTAVAFFDPAWNVDPSKLALRYFLIGDQTDSDNAFDEWRYWDNIVLTVTHKVP